MLLLTRLDPLRYSGATRFCGRFLALFFVRLATARFTAFLRIVARLLPTFDFVVRLFLLAVAIPHLNLDVRTEE